MPRGLHEFDVGIGKRRPPQLSYDFCSLEFVRCHLVGGNVVDAGCVHERGVDLGELVRGCAALPQ